MVDPWEYDWEDDTLPEEWEEYRKEQVFNELGEFYFLDEDEVIWWDD
jgi:hypothetical protein